MKQRESNIELLRIVAMLMVLIVHADFAALGYPTPEVAHTIPGWTLVRYGWEALAVVCVNVFVLISGWFGIRATKKGFCKFIFQVLFFSLGVYGAGRLLWPDACAGITWPDMLLCRHGLYWFIPAYTLLYLFSPVLNAYVEKASQKQLGWTILLFFIFQWIYGFVFGEDPAFKYGYSALSFMGLYLLARYAHLYPGKVFSMPAWADALVYLGCAALVVLTGFLSAYYDINFGQAHAIAYNNPVVIIESLALLLCFSKLHFQSKAINYVSQSAFAVFLLHLNPAFYFGEFKPRIVAFAADFTPWQTFGMIVVYLLAVYLLAILLDQLRRLLWKAIENLAFSR